VFLFLLLSQFEGGLIEPPLRVVCDLLEFDLDRAVQALVLKSLIQIGEGPRGYLLYDMPEMARTFARDRLIAGHLLQRQVIGEVDRVRAVAGVLDGDLVQACASIYESVRAREYDEHEIGWYAGAARILASYDPDCWIYVARTEHEAGYPEEPWETRLQIRGRNKCDSGRNP
jgi:hypothetical protein